MQNNKQTEVDFGFGHIYLSEEGAFLERVKEEENIWQVLNWWAAMMEELAGRSS